MLTPKQMAKFRKTLAKTSAEVTWDKPTVNAALQAVSDVLDGVFDAALFVAEMVTLDPEAQAVQDELDSMKPDQAWLRPVVEGWLRRRPPSITKRARDDSALTTWIATNSGA